MALKNSYFLPLLFLLRIPSLLAQNVFSLQFGCGDALYKECTNELEVTSVAGSPHTSSAGFQVGM